MEKPMATQAVQNNSILYGLTYVYFNESTKIDTDLYKQQFLHFIPEWEVCSIEDAATGTHNTIITEFCKGWNIIEAVVNADYWNQRGLNLLLHFLNMHPANR